MTQRETFQVQADAAEVYDQDLVPIFFERWAPVLADAAGVGPDSNALDVACGSGVVARELARRAASPAQVTGTDLNAGMLDVARSRNPEINWVEADASSLPFDDERFDAVICQAGLMFFPDQVAAVKGMNRVLKKRGSLVQLVWDESPAHAELCNIVEQLNGPEDGNILRAPFVFQDDALLRSIYAVAGVEITETQTRDGIANFESLDAFLDIQIASTPLAGKVNVAAAQAIAPETMSRFVNEDGSLSFPMNAIIVKSVKR